MICGFIFSFIGLIGILRAFEEQQQTVDESDNRNDEQHDRPRRVLYVSAALNTGKELKH